MTTANGLDSSAYPGRFAARIGRGGRRWPGGWARPSSGASSPAPSPAPRGGGGSLEPGEVGGRRLLALGLADLVSQARAHVIDRVAGAIDPAQGPMILQGMPGGVGQVLAEFQLLGG